MSEASSSLSLVDARQACDANHISKQKANSVTPQTLSKRSRTEYEHDGLNFSKVRFGVSQELVYTQGGTPFHSGQRTAQVTSDYFGFVMLPSDPSQSKENLLQLKRVAHELFVNQNAAPTASFGERSKLFIFEANSVREMVPSDIVCTTKTFFLAFGSDGHSGNLVTFKGRRAVEKRMGLEKKTVVVYIREECDESKVCSFKGFKQVGSLRTIKYTDLSLKSLFKIAKEACGTNKDHAKLYVTYSPTGIKLTAFTVNNPADIKLFDTSFKRADKDVIHICFGGKSPAKKSDIKIEMINAARKVVRESYFNPEHPYFHGLTQEHTNLLVNVLSQKASYVKLPLYASGDFLCKNICWGRGAFKHLQAPSKNAHPPSDGEIPKTSSKQNSNQPANDKAIRVVVEREARPPTKAEERRALIQEVANLSAVQSTLSAERFAKLQESLYEDIDKL
jgi:hypothetical protein